MGTFSFVIPEGASSKEDGGKKTTEKETDKQGMKKPPDKPIFYKLVSMSKDSNYILLFDDGGDFEDVSIVEAYAILEKTGSFWAIKDGQVYEGEYFYQYHEERHRKYIELHAGGKTIADGYNGMLYWDNEEYAIDEI